MDDAVLKGHVAHELREAMVKKGISQAALAKASGLSEATVRRVLRANGSPTVGSLARIADALGMRVEFLFRSRTAKSRAT
jgi:gp16 family phage-associated protein